MAWPIWLGLLLYLSSTGCRSTLPPPPALVEHRLPPPAGAARAPLLVVLHGFGAHERDLLPVVTPLADAFEVVSLRAPLTLGTDSFAWYPLERTATGFSARPADVQRAVDLLSAWLVAQGTRPSYLLGFSQGASLALGLAAQAPVRVRGAVALAPPRLPSLPVAQASESAPVLLLTGAQDPLVPSAVADAVERDLLGAHVPVERQVFPAGHEVTPAMQAMAHRWLRAGAAGR